MAAKPGKCVPRVICWTNKQGNRVCRLKRCKQRPPKPPTLGVVIKRRGGLL